MRELDKWIAEKIMDDVIRPELDTHFTVKPYTTDIELAIDAAKKAFFP